MAHLQGDIVFIIDESSYCGNSDFGYNFLDKDYSAPPPFGTQAAHVKAQIDFFKVGMKGDRPTHDFGLEK
jgi:hypothetical protein